ncbi:coniferyl aldehyde dehydrogenase [Rugamonas apoptosis]|uniref:Aldehyde dehydrogenase n=1 Tax=Rugamonas apoptosis TaxID=2758570 RepID=A0A7W2F7Q7_9BURK|nr:coniferyl aldehyde dehydrogenase [Rugamonas apoptosis]MBA5686665.1 coniferyl aldehyde dehydrogenase [Rugamonas apoptosis]
MNTIVATPLPASPAYVDPLPAHAPPARAASVDLDQPPPAHLAQLLARQRAAYLAQPYPDAAQRKDKLRRLLKALRQHQDALCDALSADFGIRSVAESKIGDLLTVATAIRHTIGQLDKWMKPRRRSAELLFAVNSAWVEYQPKGVVGIIAPWNFPVYLSLGPLVASLAAGNRALIKMSEFSPHTTRALRTMLADAFEPDEVCVLGGDVEVGRAFSALPFDHLIFTGSTVVGRHVMRAAAENLVPVTLELGGKSPAIVSRSASVAEAAARIAHGKGFNCGQICVAPDYALVPRERLDSFVEAVKMHFRRMYPATSVRDADYSNVVTPAHAERLHRMLADARAKGGRVIACEEGAHGQRLPLHLVLDASDDMAVCREEIFGPILPVIAYDDVEQVIAYVNERPRPLALYWFGANKAESEALRRRTHAGGMTINDWGWHVFQNDLPFGGIGASGSGSYHGIEGFHALSHGKSIFRERPWFPIRLLHPPYGNLAQRWALKLYLGTQKGRTDVNTHK